MGFIHGLGTVLVGIGRAVAVPEENLQQITPVGRQGVMNAALGREDDAVTGGAEPLAKVWVESAKNVLAFATDGFENGARTCATSVASEVAVGDVIDNGGVEAGELAGRAALEGGRFRREDYAGAGHADSGIGLQGPDQPLQHMSIGEAAVVVDDDEEFSTGLGSALVDGASLGADALNEMNLEISIGLGVNALEQPRNAAVSVPIAAGDNDGAERVLACLGCLLHNPPSRPHPVAATRSPHPY